MNTVYQTKINTSSMHALSDDKIVNSWSKNVDQWTRAIRNGEIDSRVLTTNKAILLAVLKSAPKKVLDIGCGEGWLVRELTKTGIEAMGIDAVPGLIDVAVKEGFGNYHVMSYEDLSYAALNEKYDVVVSNFSLLGNESVTNIFKKVPSILVAGGYFIVQTIHPLSACSNEEYKDGWRRGSWDGFSETFTDPAPWYFRTLESWKLLYEENGFELERIDELKSENNGTLVSIIFVGRTMN
jgi:2-polyprenyl-3-methyl-5-hydroxy-6-metoxy-1,4-benzoquinol methylase